MTSLITTVKLLTAFVIFLCGLASTILPLFVAGRNEALFSAGNMMASGVLLAAGLVHQLADSAASLDSDNGYPWSFLICGLTFILFLIFEETVHLLIGGHSHGEDMIMKLGEPRQTQLTQMGSCRGSVSLGVGEPLVVSTPYGHDHSHEHRGETGPLLKKKPRQASNPDNSSSFNKGGMFWDPKKSSNIWNRSSIFGGDPNRMSVAGSHHHHDDHIAEHLHGSILASLMLLAALSLHSVLAGLSIGLVNNVDEILSIAAAIIAHKVFAGYALGSTMVASDMGWDRHIPSGIAFSLSTPLGIFIGMGLSSGSYDEDSATIGIVKAIVAGTFLYVAIIEVGMKELLICRTDSVEMSRYISLSQKQTEVLKLVCLLAGFLGMSALAAYI